MCHVHQEQFNSGGSVFTWDKVSCLVVILGPSRPINPGWMSQSFKVLLLTMFISLEPSLMATFNVKYHKVRSRLKVNVSSVNFSDFISHRT